MLLKVCLITSGTIPLILCTATDSATGGLLVPLSDSCSAISTTHIPDLDASFKKEGITLLHEEEIGAPIESLQHYWADAQDHRNFLVREGDLEIEHGEWLPFNLEETNSYGNVGDDSLLLNYSHSRSFSYAHPRTSTSLRTYFT